MKKLVSILLALMMLLALAVPAMATRKVFTGSQTINGGNYPEGIYVGDNVTLTIEGTVEISSNLSFGNNSTLVINRNAKLIGKDLMVSLPQQDCKIEIYGINDGNNVTNGSTGEINIMTHAEIDTRHLTTVLKNSGCTNYIQNGNHFVIGCPHDHKTIETTTTVKEICEDCEAVVHTEVKTETGEPQVTTTNTDSGTASNLSEGNMTIILCVACSVVFLVVGFVLGRKKLKTED